MELLVVLLIIGILSTVALRTIDATRDRGLFDKTTKAMDQLVQAMVGNSNLSYDGRRVDFGYYGDMEELPAVLQDLVRNPGSTAWHGPYLHLAAGGAADSSYLFDGWGDVYTWQGSAGKLTSDGHHKYPMTVSVIDDTAQLHDNIIAGTITDMNNAAPGDPSVSHVSVTFYYNNPAAHGGVDSVKIVPTPGGYYEFSPSTISNPCPVPIGIHKLVASTPTESLIRYVTVLPRSKTIVDFKFSSSFWGKLKLVAGSTMPTTDGKGFLFDVINTQTQDDTVSSLAFLKTSQQLYVREDFRIGPSDHDGFPIPSGDSGKGPGDAINFTTPVPIAPSALAELYFYGFYVAPVPLGGDTSVLVHGNTFEFRFSDGSEITVKP